MIANLFKHELLRTWKLVLVTLGGAVLISGLGSLAVLAFPGPLGAVAGVLGFLIACVLPLAVMLGLGVDFYRSTYSRTGYLTAALPVSGASIYWVKFCFAYVVALLSLGVALVMGTIGFAALNTLDGTSTFADGWAAVQVIPEALGALPVWMQVVLVILVLLAPATGLAQYWYAVTVGSESWINKLGLGGVVLMWFAFYVASQIIAVVAIFIPPYLDLSDPFAIKVLGNPMALFAENSTNAVVPLVALLVGYLLSVVAIWWGKVSYDRRLELR